MVAKHWSVGESESEIYGWPTRSVSKSGSGMERSAGVETAHLDLRIIADVMQDGIPGHFGTYWVVRKDGPIHTIGDMRHHRAAVNARGTGIDMLLHEAMRGHGVADGDYTIIEADFANMLPLIENDKVDTVPVMPQFGHDFEATGRYRTLFDLPSVAGPSQVGFWVMRADFIAAHRPAIVDFLEDDMRAVLDRRSRQPRGGAGDRDGRHEAIA